MPAVPLSESDRRILRVLQTDASLSAKALAERVALSASTVWRRVQELEAAGVVVGRATLVDPDAVGLSVCVLIHVNIAAHTDETRRAFEAFALREDAVLQCFAVTGAHDYTLVVRTPSVADFEDFLMRKLLAQPSVASTSTHLVLRQHKNATALPV